MPPFEAVKTMAMSLPEAHERTSYNTPVFYVGKKLFARLREDGCSLVVNAADLIALPFRRWTQASSQFPNITESTR